MPYQNLSAVLLPADVTAILAAVETIKAKLPFVISLTEDERKTIPKMGSKSIEFVDDALQTAQQNPTSFPATFNIPEFAKDVNLSKALKQIVGPISQIAEQINDTMMAAGSESMVQALDVYEYVKTGKDKTAGFDVIADKLGKRFKEAGLKSKAAREAKKPKKTTTPS